jgi:hypothetical protein
MSALIRDAAWQQRNAAVAPVDLKALGRQALPAALGALEDNIDRYNVAFRSLAAVNVAAVRADPALLLAEANLRALVAQYWTLDHRLDTDRIGWDWPVDLLRKYLLFQADSAHVLDAGALTGEQVQARLFEIVDTTIALHTLCDMDDAELQRVRDDCRTLLLFDAAHDLFEHLRPAYTVQDCKAELVPWTDDQHRAFLFFLGIDLAYRFAGSYVCWDTIVARDSYDIVRGLYFYYMLNHEDLFLAVLRRHAGFRIMYRNTIYLLLVVLGYVSPYHLRPLFTQVAVDGYLPGGCEHDFDSVLQVWATYCACWFYNDRKAHLATEFPLRMPEWPRLPPGSDPDKAQHVLLVSVYTYFTPKPFRWATAPMVLFCSGARTFHEAHCDPAAREMYQAHPPPRQPPPGWSPVPVGPAAAALHAVGQMAHGLYQSVGAADDELVAMFEAYLRISEPAGDSLIRIARNSPRAADTLRRMGAFATAAGASRAITALIEHEIEEIEGPADAILHGLFGVDLPLYRKDDAQAPVVMTKAIGDLVANFQTHVAAAIKKIDDGLKQPPTPADPASICNPLTAALLRIAFCPDSLAGLGDPARAGDKSRGAAALWSAIRIGQPFSDLQRRIGDVLAARGAIPGAQVLDLGPPADTETAIEGLRAMGIVTRAENGTLAFSPHFHFGAF